MGPMYIQLREPKLVVPRIRFRTNRQRAPMPMGSLNFATRSMSFMNHMRKQNIIIPISMAISCVRAVPRSAAASRFMPMPESR